MRKGLLVTIYYPSIDYFFFFLFTPSFFASFHHDIYVAFAFALFLTSYFKPAFCKVFYINEFGLFFPVCRIVYRQNLGASIFECAAASCWSFSIPIRPWMTWSTNRTTKRPFLLGVWYEWNLDRLLDAAMLTEKQHRISVFLHIHQVMKLRPSPTIDLFITFSMVGSTQTRLRKPQKNLMNDVLGTYY